MKYFNYDTLWIISHGNPEKILDYFKDSEVGPHFIVNQKALVDAFWLTAREKAEYLGICSLRNYNDYLLTGDVDLSLDLVPNWVPIQVIKSNPLVTITDTKIILKKENV